MYSTNHNLSTIDKLYGFYYEVSWLGPSQTERRTAGSKGTNVEQILENYKFNWVLKLTRFCYPWWIVILFVNKLWNYLIAGSQNILRNVKIYDSGQKHDIHNYRESSRVSHCRRLPKREIFNIICYVKHFLQLFFEFHIESGQNHFVIHADNVKLYTARMSHIVW
jgi:hypothetical protein